MTQSIIHHIQNSPIEPSNDNSLDLKDLLQAIKDISKRTNGAPVSMITGMKAKDDYINSCLRYGIPMAEILKTITDHGDGTFIIEINNNENTTHNQPSSESSASI